MNELQTTGHKPSFSMVISTPRMQKAINNTLQDPNRARRFTSAIISAVSSNPALAECDASTIVSAALLGESLNLSPSPQLGQYYLVPFNDSKNRRKTAQFQLGYKGYIQLAIRSGYYKKLIVCAIKDGENPHYDELTDEFTYNRIEDDEIREQTATIGYYAMFEYQNGFQKKLYCTRQKMEIHAERYSQGYRARKGYTFWEKDFDAMAYKTMLRQLISKWGIMSIEMQDVYQKDMAVLSTDGNVDYVEAGEYTPIDTESTVLTESEPSTAGTSAAEDVPPEFFEEVPDGV